MVARAEAWSWSLYALKDRPGWSILWRDGAGRRREVRVPQKYVEEGDARKYAREWVAEKQRLAGWPQATVGSHSSSAMTLRQLGDDWTSGRLHARFPDHVAEKRSSRADAGRLKNYVFPLVGDIAVSAFEEHGLDYGERVMTALPPTLSRGSRRHVAQLLHRLLKLATFPLRLLKNNPLPTGWLPRQGSPKALVFLFPDEDRKLLGCTSVPLVLRVLYGFLAREGLRVGEALALRWKHIDLDRGTISLDLNKTDDPRFWALHPSVTTALARWKRNFRSEADEETLVFVRDDGVQLDRFGLPDDLRSRLKHAGVDRALLFETNANRQPIRVHDLRATFVTLGFANNRTEGWLMDRTGHCSSQMLARYRRAARSIAELNLGDLEPLADAIPELQTTKPTNLHRPRALPAVDLP